LAREVEGRAGARALLKFFSPLGPSVLPWHLDRITNN